MVFSILLKLSPKRMVVWIAAALLVLQASLFSTPTIKAQDDYVIYLPLVLRECLDGAAVQAVAQLLLTDGNQQHPTLECNMTLSQTAMAHAQDMAQRDYFGHTNPEGYGPNHRATQAGYTLPSHYGNGPTANNIESIAAGFPTPADIWQTWMNSPGHRNHLLGLSSFYAEQIDYGIGYAYNPNSRYRHYWVILIAKPGP